MIITEVSFTIHASHSFIAESCFYFLNSDILDWLYYIMHIFLSKRILCDFCIETFPEFLYCRGVGTALSMEGENWDLPWNCICIVSSWHLLWLYSCLVWKLVIKTGERLEYSQARPGLPLLLYWQKCSCFIT